VINSAISLPDVLSFIYVEVIRIQICKTQRARMACFCEMFPLPRPQTEKYEKEKNTKKRKIREDSQARRALSFANTCDVLLCMRTL
jgi:hypothetical protein